MVVKSKNIGSHAKYLAKNFYKDKKIQHEAKPKKVHFRGARRKFLGVCADLQRNQSKS